MSSAKQTRNNLGISQPAFADLLNCTRGQLAMHETGKRMLPAASLHALGLLQLALARVAAVSPRPQPLLPARHVRELILLQEKTKDKLQLTAEKMNRVQLLVTIGTDFESDPFLPDEGDAHARMKLLKRQAEKKLTRLRQAWTRYQILMAGIDEQIQKARELGNF